jgi:chemotaxis signal transduction protein
VFDKSGWFGSKERVGLKDKKLIKGGTDRVDNLLLFSMGNCVYAIEGSFLRRIVKNQEIVHLPNEPEFIPGVIRLHFGVAKVIDIRKIIPLDIPLGPHARIVVFRSQTNESIYYGLIVDEVIGFVELPRERVTSMVSTARYINNNFMQGWFMFGVEEYKNQVHRKATDGDDKIVLINFEEMISAIMNNENTDEFVFRLTALFNPDYLLSEEYQEILRLKQNKKVIPWN